VVVIDEDPVSGAERLVAEEPSGDALEGLERYASRQRHLRQTARKLAGLWVDIMSDGEAIVLDDMT
jgi:hypothetical protein